MTVSQADVLEYYLRAQDGVQAVKVYDRTQDAVVLYEAERGNIIRALAQFSFAKAEAMELVPEHTSRALNREFEDKLAVAEIDLLNIGRDINIRRETFEFNLMFLSLYVLEGRY